MWSVLLATALTFAGPFGIDVGYYLHLGVGQWRLIWDQRPIEDVIADVDTTPRIRERLALAQDIRSFAIDRLGLAGSDNYTTFSDIGEGPVVWALTVCEPDELSPHRWSYPVIGSAPYRGFFDRERGRLEKARYDERGFDTYLRGVSAFSTLGWFRDPLLSSVLQYPPLDLADVIIHELMHATIWIENDADFNEQLASFVGREGARAWMLETVEGGADSLAARSRLKADRDLYRSLMHGLATQLDSLYRSDVSRAQKLLRKSEVIDELRQSAEDAPWQTGRYVDPESWTINNATLGLFRTYNQSSDIFDRVLERSGDLKSALQVFDRCGGEQDPHDVLERWLDENTAPE